MKIKVGDIVKVFHSQEWKDVGFDQPEGNERFWREAEIISIEERAEYGGLDYYTNLRLRNVATIKWLHTGKISWGHIISGMRGVESV